MAMVTQEKRNIKIHLLFDPLKIKKRNIKQISDDMFIEFINN